VVDRGISHELVRHRPASFAQESTRYCNYAQDKFGGQITFIIPEFFNYGSPEWKIWKENITRSEADYLALIALGVSPEKARGVLGTSLKTEVIMTANCAEWKHFFRLRACNATGKAHPQMLEVAQPLLDDFKKAISVIFDDLDYERKDDLND
jgi:thymidylate synthase (FAD)